MEHLKHLEDLTRRYTQARVCGAGLGPLWAGVTLALFTLLTFGHMQSQFSSLADPHSGFWQFMLRVPLLTPSWLKTAALLMPVVAWFGIAIIQHLVDQRMGVAKPYDKSSMLERWLLPLLLIVQVLVAIGYNLGAALAIHDNTGSSIAANIDGATHLGWVLLAAWAVAWLSVSRDSGSRSVVILTTAPAMWLMSSRLDETDIFILVGHLILISILAVIGLRQFSDYLKVRRAINMLAAQLT